MGRHPAALLGLIASVKGGDAANRALHRGAAAWWAVSAILLLGNPLAWQRYYLPLVPPTAMLTTLGVLWLAGWLRGRLLRSSG